jgi:hypothetical protein
MSTVELEATKFSKQIFSDGYVFSIDKAKSKLDQKLSLLYRDEDKLNFLRKLKEENQIEITEHKIKCDKSECQFMKDRNAGMFLYNQEIEYLNEHYVFKPLDEDKFTPQDQANYDQKINDILQKLESLGHGQEVIYEEIESLKNYYNLGKKTWTQLLAGKVVSVGIDKTLEEIIFNDPIKYLSEQVDNII